MTTSNPRARWPGASTSSARPSTSPRTTGTRRCCTTWRASCATPCPRPPTSRSRSTTSITTTAAPPGGPAPDHRPGRPGLWARDQEPQPALADYRTDEGTPWPKVVLHIEQLLTATIGTELGGMWLGPEHEDGNIVFWCKLPAVDLAAIQARQPRNMVAYLAEDDPRPWGTLWFSRPTPHPTKAVASVAITASIADHDARTAEIDPTKTPRR